MSKKLLQHIVFFWLCMPMLVQGQLVITVAGETQVSGERDGNALTEAQFNNPHDIDMDDNGNVYIADRWNHKIRKLDTKTGIVSTLAGTGEIGSADGPGATAEFYEPWGLAVGPDGYIYIADTKNYKIRRMDTLGNVITVAGSGSFGVANGPALSSRFARPSAIAVDHNGIIYVGDQLGHTIRKVANGVVTTLAGKAFIDGRQDGVGGNATFHRPYNLEVDKEGNVYVMDNWNHLIRKVSPIGVVTTVAGSGSIGSTDGPVDSAKFNFPWDMAISDEGTIYFMDGYNYILRKIENGRVETIAGEAAEEGAADGFGDQARFSGATGIALDSRNGDLYIGDAYNNLIRKVILTSEVALEGETTENGDTICSGATETFKVEPYVFTSYSFFVNDVLTQFSTEPYFNYTFTETGNYTIEARVTDSLGLEIGSNDWVLEVVESPNSTFEYEVLGNQGDGLQVQFRALNNASFYQWDFGDIGNPSNQSNIKEPVYTYVDEGTYSVSLVTNNGGPCYDTLSMPDIINYSALNLLAANWARGDTICTGQSDTLTASLGFDEYVFFLNGQELQRSSDRNFIPQISQAGSYSVRVEGNISGGITAEATFPLVAVDIPDIDFTITSEEVIQEGLSVSFAASGAANSYVWNFGDPGSGSENVANGAVVNHIYSQEGTYSVSLEASNGSTCSSEVEKDDLLRYVRLALQIDAPYFHGDTICWGTSTSFTTQPADFQQYTYRLNDQIVQTGSSPVLSLTFDQVNLIGQATIEVEAQDESGGQYIAAPIRLTISPEVESRFDFEILGATENGLEVQFYNRTSNAEFSVWDFGDPLSGSANQSTELNPIHNYQSFGTYTVSLTSGIYPQCANSIILTDTVIFEKKDNGLFIPTGFTPNGDGRNDVFYVRGEQVTALNLKIYNEWGTLIHEITDPAMGWDGTYEGQALKADNYVYIGTIEFFDQPPVCVQGKITLLK